MSLSWGMSRIGTGGCAKVNLQLKRINEAERGAATMELPRRSQATNAVDDGCTLPLSVVASCAHRQICGLRSFAASGCRRRGWSRRYTYADYNSRLGSGDWRKASVALCSKARSASGRAWPKAHSTAGPSRIRVGSPKYAPRRSAYTPMALRS